MFHRIHTGDMSLSVVCCHYRKVVHMFRTGDGLLMQVNGATEDGLKEIFATNVFGHFVLVS